MDIVEALRSKEVQVMLAIARDDRNELWRIMNDGKPIKARAIIAQLKNRPDELDLFLHVLGTDPGAGGYFFREVTDNRTFDVYAKHHIAPLNLDKETVTPEQWAYLLQIGYVTDYENSAEDEGPAKREGPAEKEGPVAAEPASVFEGSAALVV